MHEITGLQEGSNGLHFFQFGFLRFRNPAVGSAIL
jgi:hypothetical protein